MSTSVRGTRFQKPQLDHTGPSVSGHFLQPCIVLYILPGEAFFFNLKAHLVNVHVVFALSVLR